LIVFSIKRHFLNSHELRSAKKTRLFQTIPSEEAHENMVKAAVEDRVSKVRKIFIRDAVEEVYWPRSSASLV
jgi:hypothetical protein